MSDSVKPHRRQPTRFPPSLGFSRQHWNGLLFPSPMHESDKWKWSSSVVSDLMTPWTSVYQAPPSMGFPRQEYWSGVPLPSPWDISSGYLIHKYLEWGVLVIILKVKDEAEPGIRIDMMLKSQFSTMQELWVPGGAMDVSTPEISRYLGKGLGIHKMKNK